MGREKKPLKQVRRLALRQIAFDPVSHPRFHGEDEIEELAQSLLSKGLQEPILVHESGAGGPHRLVVGARRFLAAKRLGWRQIDCLTLGDLFRREIATIDRLQKDDCDPWELAEALVHLQAELGWTQAHLGIAIGRSRNFVADILAIARITPQARRLILDHKRGSRLSPRHLRYVGRAAPSSQLEVAGRILTGELSTTELQREKKVAAVKPAEVRYFQVRQFRKPGTAVFPTTAKEWRNYCRQLNTDLKRIGRREKLESRRSRETIGEAKLRQRLVKKEAHRRRRELTRELKQAIRRLARAGGG